MTWIDLPSSGFISGAAATKSDVEAGNAVFSMDGKGEGPLQIAIPQYAIFTEDDGSKRAVVVVQAEQAPGGMRIVGLLNSDGSYTAATMESVELLGTEKPD